MSAEHKAALKAFLQLAVVKVESSVVYLDSSKVAAMVDLKVATRDSHWGDYIQADMMEFSAAVWWDCQSGCSEAGPKVEQKAV